MSFFALAPPGVGVAPRSRLSPRATRGRTGALPWSSCAVTRVRRVVPLCGTMETVRERCQTLPLSPQPIPTKQRRFDLLSFFTTKRLTLSLPVRCALPTAHRFSEGLPSTGLLGGLHLRFTPSGDGVRLRVAR